MDPRLSVTSRDPLIRVPAVSHSKTSRTPSDAHGMRWLAVGMPRAHAYVVGHGILILRLFGEVPSPEVIRDACQLSLREIPYARG